MPTVKPIDRKTVDGWPLHASGLPTRVVNGARSKRLSTVGALRRLLHDGTAELPGVGATSRQGLARFFELCDALEAGRPGMDRLTDGLRFFLCDRQVETLAARYGLYDMALSLSDPCETLQRIGWRRGMSRERIRQVEQRAKTALSSRLAQACFSDLYRFLAATVDCLHGVMTAEELAALPPIPFLRDCNPCRALRLLCDCGGPVVYHRAVLTTLPRRALETLERRLPRVLEQASEPLDVPRILQVLPVPGAAESSLTRPALPSGAGAKLIRCLLDRRPDVASTFDRRYLLRSRAIPLLIGEAMASLPQPAHFRAIQGVLNAMLQPGSRLGPGRVLAFLMGDSRFERTASGYYRLSGRGREVDGAPVQGGAPRLALAPQPTDRDGGVKPAKEVPLL